MQTDRRAYVRERAMRAMREKKPKMNKMIGFVTHDGGCHCKSGTVMIEGDANTIVTTTTIITITTATTITRTHTPALATCTQPTALHTDSHHLACMFLLLTERAFKSRCRCAWGMGLCKMVRDVHTRTNVDTRHARTQGRSSSRTQARTASTRKTPIEARQGPEHRSRCELKTVLANST